ncbi:hypothetical protein [Enterococcus hermanniensis]|uniref:hypothetical protein n=1 Tax=Enterococcus hermanniensis TaxID=249189 RepID=UPI000AF919D4|nr:hypothetical protein [Enterococcus hermanniensis]
MKRVTIGIPIVLIVVIGGGLYFSDKETAVLNSFDTKQETKQNKTQNKKRTVLF